MTLSRLDCLYLAKVADQAERHQGMPYFVVQCEGEAEKSIERVLQDVIARMKTLIKRSQAQLTIDERNLLSIAYKNVTATLRSSWRSIDTLQRRPDAQHSPRHLILIGKEKETIERELADTCKDITSLLDQQLIPASDFGEERVFYYKM